MADRAPAAQSSGQSKIQSGANAALSIIGLASQQISGFVITLLAAGFLAPVEYGVYTLAIVFVELVLAFTYAGFYHFVVTSSEDDTSVLSTMFWLMQLVGWIGGGALIVFASWLAQVFDSPDLAPVLRYLGLLQPFASGMAWAGAVLIRRQQMRRHFIIMLLQNSAAMLGGAVVLWLWQSLFALVVYRYIRVVIGVFLYGVMTPDRPHFLFDRPMAAHALRYASGLYGSRLLVFVSNFGTDLLLAYFFTTAESGLYRFANRLSTATIDIVGQPLRSFALNQFGAAARTGAQLEPVLNRFCGVMVILMGGFAASILVFGADLVTTLFHPSYLAALGALYALSVRAFAGFGNALILPIFAARNKTQVSMYHNLLWTSVMIATIFVTSDQGLNTLAFAQACVAILTAIAALALISWQGEVPIRGAVYNILIALAVVGAYYAAASGLWLWIKGGIGVSGLSLGIGLSLATLLALATIGAGMRLRVFDMRVFAER
ncbi:oligosaccharide flippase family protein [Shimia sp.]|uniref:oligosaccharide flippase family protein n=1 Tax=Shimia sp. TaxID=1954381 RepID=UPI003BAACE9F